MSDTKPRVLCVDDEAGVLRALTWLLQKDFEITTTTEPDRAIELAAEGRYDVVISDQRMPGKTGVEVLREIRDRTPSTMRILLTGYSDLEATLASVNEGEVFRYINKPWDNDALRRTVSLAANAARVSPAAPAPVDLDADNSEKFGVLIVDENPQIRMLIDQSVGPNVNVMHAADLHEAMGIIEEQNVAVLVIEIAVGGANSMGLIRLLKHEHPEIVTVVLTDQHDADVVIRLINHGQIYRFIPKPVRAGLLRLALRAALTKHNELKSQPALHERHTVDNFDLEWMGPTPALATVPAGRGPATMPKGSNAAGNGGGVTAFFGALRRRLFGGKR
jgi:DNA-binding NtrC family response regulator